MTFPQNQATVWTIAGSDSGGGAGIQADLLTFHDLNTFGCSAITAMTAQNSVEVLSIQASTPDFLQAQIAALESDLPAKCIKLGMLGSKEIMETLLPFLRRYPGPIIIDPVMIAASGARLCQEDAQAFFSQHILPYATVLTPNLYEAQALTHSENSVEMMANQLLQQGAKSVLIKGGHAEGEDAQDYWTNGKTAFYLTTPRYFSPHTHGSGCTLSAAISAALGLGYPLADALVIAKSYVSQGIRLAKPQGAGPGPVAHAGWPHAIQDFPTLTSSSALPQYHFPRCQRRLGFYPIVDRATKVKDLLEKGVKTIQLRIKELDGLALEKEIAESIQTAKQYPETQLFMNDYWKLAIAHGAYGVHLGQEDLDTADLKAIERAGLRLGISAHSYAEFARTHALKPSYLACGPIFPTQSKKMSFAPQGVSQLAYWRRMLPYPVVAIGGISLENLPGVLEAQPDGVAVISALEKTGYSREAIQTWLEMVGK